MATWHDDHLEKRSAGERLSDSFASLMGSWKYLIVSNVLVLLWIVFNIIVLFQWHWDPYPFILLNLVFSWFSYNSTSFVLMSQNRSGQRDREQAEHDYQINRDAKKEIESLQKSLYRVETEKLDRAVELLGIIVKLLSEAFMKKLTVTQSEATHVRRTASKHSTKRRAR